MNQNPPPVQKKRSRCGRKPVHSKIKMHCICIDKQFKLYYIVYDSATGKIVYSQSQVSAVVAGHTSGPSISWTPNSGGLYKVMILLYSNTGYNLNAVIGDNIDTITIGS
ncbi:hypothetical protein [Candidatus Nitrosotenuis uzonensis]|uniref:hypothetical protein n=1 Tax=Candidatus Nitrosotenuis uzonensis TaxID=1407055 RepID=UPI0012DC1878|nr:hypothetical protein [Candidatus Nitrosotenuis uzonensis]